MQMNKKEFMKIKEELQCKLGKWKLEIGDEILADFTIGCFYDTCVRKWKVYVNNERGRHRIRLMTENEEEAFDELLSIVNFEIENNKYI